MKQSDIIEKIRKLGYKVTVINATHMNRAGMPDILISHNGYPVFIEIKIDRDKLSKLQINFAEEFSKGWACLHYDSKTNRFQCFQCETWASSVHQFARQLSDKLNAK